MPTKPPTHKVKRTRRPDGRLSSYRRGYGGKAWGRLRARVFVRDLGLCVECGRPCVKSKQAHVDHVVPKASGGKDTMDNLQLLCDSCHAKKTRAEARQGVGGSENHKC